MNNLTNEEKKNIKKLKDVKVDNLNATNSLIMNDYYLTGRNVLSKKYSDMQVLEAKMDVDENHK